VGFAPHSHKEPSKLIFLLFFAVHCRGRLKYRRANNKSRERSTPRTSVEMGVYITDGSWMPGNIHPATSKDGRGNNRWAQDRTIVVVVLAMRWLRRHFSRRKKRDEQNKKKGTMAPNGALWYRWCWRFLGLLVLPVVPAGTVARGATDCVPHLSFTHQRTAKQSEHGQMMAWMVGRLGVWDRKSSPEIPLTLYVGACGTSARHLH